MQNTLKTKTVNPLLLSILYDLMDSEIFKDFILVGGTALSLLIKLMLILIKTICMLIAPTQLELLGLGGHTILVHLQKKVLK